MNLFLVTSPFQYMCANEARIYFKCTDNILLLVNQDTEQALKIQNKILNKEHWTHIINIDRNNRTLVMPRVIKQIKKKLNGTNVEKFFYAEYTGLRTKLLIKNLNIEKEIYFDDGTLSLLEFEKYIKPKVVYNRPRFFQDLLIRLYGCKPVGSLPQSKNLEIFTLFDLGHSEFKCHQNHLKQLINKYGQPELFNPSAPIGYIGQGGIGDKNKLSITQYISELDQLTQNLGKQIIYFPHRTEKNEVRKKLIKKDYIIYHQSDYPLEIELIDKNIQLSSLIGIYSTAMFTSYYLYPNMPMYTLNDKHPDKLFQKIIREHMQKIGIRNYYDIF